MPKCPPASPRTIGAMPPTPPHGDDLPGTWFCFGVPPRSLASTLLQVLPQLAVACVVVLASCVGDVVP
jgi:hypothetical protein